ncbi:MAG: hypothetical protein D6705_08025 [Deltaproteobacteria bacterium]|nr:MAG: hypothetical protein D6705_08025 [Deltaproteobacteria bacterium]
MAPTGPLLGIVAAVCFGTADVLVRGVTRRIGWRATLFWIQAGSLPFLAVAAAAGGEGIPIAAIEWPIALAAGPLALVAAVGLYRALATGPVSVVSPVAGSFAVVAVAWAALASGTVPAWLWLCAGGTVAGVALSSPAPTTAATAASPKPVGWAALHALAFGTLLHVVGPLTRATDPLTTTALLRAECAVLALPLLRGRRAHAATPKRLLAAVILFDTLGLYAYAAAAQRPEDAPLAAVLAACFPAVAVVLSRWHLRERLRRRQAWGVAVLVGTAALATGLSSRPPISPGGLGPTRHAAPSDTPPQAARRPR